MGIIIANSLNAIANAGYVFRSQSSIIVVQAYPYCFMLNPTQLHCFSFMEYDYDESG